MARSKRSIRFSDEEWQRAKKLAEAEGISRAAYIRRVATNEDRSSMIAVLSHQLRRMNYNALQVRDRIMPYRFRENGKIADEGALEIDTFLSEMRQCVKRIARKIKEIDSEKVHLPNKPPRPIGGYGPGIVEQARRADSSTEDGEAGSRLRAE